MPGRGLAASDPVEQHLESWTEVLGVELPVERERARANARTCQLEYQLKHEKMLSVGKQQ